MKHSKKLFVGLMTIFSVIMFISCDKSDDVPLKANVDVLIQDLKTDAGIKYGLFINASSNHEIKSATVTGPDGKVYQLKTSGSNYYFSFIPQTSDYATSLPKSGNYTFEIIDSDGAKTTGKDVLTDAKLSPITIKTADVSSQKLKLAWDSISGADYYTLQILNADKSAVLFSSALVPTSTGCEITPTTKGWIDGKVPTINSNYVVVLCGVKTVSGDTNNLQFITSDSKNIKWQ